MQHEYTVEHEENKYRVGDELYATSPMINLTMSGYCKVKVIEPINEYGEYMCVDQLGHIYHFESSSLSPYPPVKPVEGWSIATPSGNILYAVMASTKEKAIELFEDQTRQTLPDGYRCIEVVITPKN